MCNKILIKVTVILGFWFTELGFKSGKIFYDVTLIYVSCHNPFYRDYRGWWVSDG